MSLVQQIKDIFDIFDFTVVWNREPLTIGKYQFYDHKNFKCKILNLYLQTIERNPPSTKIPTPEQLEYTFVLTKQSSLFNAWKEICRVHDVYNVPIRCVAMVAEKFPEAKTKKLSLAFKE